jgi:hypothetical protein
VAVVTDLARSAEEFFSASFIRRMVSAVMFMVVSFCLWGEVGRKGIHAEARSRNFSKTNLVIPAKAGTQRLPVLKIRTSAGASFRAIAAAGFPLSRE